MAAEVRPLTFGAIPLILRPPVADERPTRVLGGAGRLEVTTITRAALAGSVRSAGGGYA
jgi:hypothetical protein